MLEPYKLSKEHVVLIGMAQNHRHLAPWEDKDCEIWAINESYAERNKAPMPKNAAKGFDPGPYLKRWDRWFQLHPRWDYMRTGNFNHENHPLWITAKAGTCYACGGKGKHLNVDKPCGECKGSGVYDPAEHRRTLDFPVYLISADPNVPNSFVYPMEEIVEAYGVNEENVRYFTNSFGLMAALAIHLGCKKLSGYGWEMSSATEYGDQKPNAEFWAGVAIGRGIEVYFPDNCSLLGKKVPIYGFDKVPGITSMHAEIRLNAIREGFNKAQAEINKIRGLKESAIKRKQLAKGMSKQGMQALDNEIQGLLQKEFEQVSRINSLYGAMQEADHIHKEASMLANRGTLSYMDGSGKTHSMGIEELEIEAAHRKLEDIPEDRSDEISYVGPGSNPFGLPQDDQKVRAMAEGV